MIFCSDSRGRCYDILFGQPRMMTSYFVRTAEDDDIIFCSDSRG